MNACGRQLRVDGVVRVGDATLNRHRYRYRYRHRWCTGVMGATEHEQLSMRA